MKSKKLIFPIILSSLLSGCFNNDINSTNLSPNLGNAQLSGRVLGKNIQNSKVFLDYNFNGQWDENEPWSTVDISGDFTVKSIDSDLVDFSPIVVDILASSRTSNLGYQLTYPPKFTNDISNDEKLIVSTFSTSLAVEANSFIIANELDNALALSKNKELQDQLSVSVKNQMQQISTRYGIPAEKLFNDYESAGNTEISSIADQLAEGLAHSLPEVKKLAEKYKTADRVTVEFYLEKDTNGEFSKWKRQDKVHWYATNEWEFFTYDVTPQFNIEKLTSEDIYRTKQNGDVVYKQGHLINYNPEYRQYFCDKKVQAESPRKETGGIAFTFETKATYSGDSRDTCLASHDDNVFRSYRIGKIDFLNQFTMKDAGWFYYYSDTTPALNSFAEKVGLNQISNANEFNIFNELDIGLIAMDLNTTHDSSNYTRGHFWSKDNIQFELYRHVGADGNGWEEKEILPSGVINYRCSDTNRDSLKSMTKAECDALIRNQA